MNPPALVTLSAALEQEGGSMINLSSAGESLVGSWANKYMEKESIYIHIYVYVYIERERALCCAYIVNSCYVFLVHIVYVYNRIMDILRAQEPDSWLARPKQAQASREAGKQTSKLLL